MRRPDGGEGRVRRRRLSEMRPARVRDRFGLGADITWKPAPVMKMPSTVRVVLHELRKWQVTGRHFMNYRELGEACDLPAGDVHRACVWLDKAGLLDDRREPT